MKALLNGEPIYPPSHKPSKAESVEQKRQADRDAEKAKRQREREQVEREQEKDRASRERFRELPAAERESILAKVLAEHPEARMLPADSPIIEALCLTAFEKCCVS